MGRSLHMSDRLVLIKPCILQVELHFTHFLHLLVLTISTVFSVRMAQIVQAEYTPSSIARLVDDKDTRLISSTSARALLRSGVSRDGKHHSLQGGGLHLSFAKLFQETRNKSPGETHSQANVIYRTLSDTLDNVSS